MVKLWIYSDSEILLWFWCFIFVLFYINHHGPPTTAAQMTLTRNKGLIRSDWGILLWFSTFYQNQIPEFLRAMISSPHLISQLNIMYFQPAMSVYQRINQCHALHTPLKNHYSIWTYFFLLPLQRTFVPLPLSFMHATAPAARTCNSPTMAKARRGSDSQRLEKVPNIIASRAKRCLGDVLLFSTTGKIGVKQGIDQTQNWSKSMFNGSKSKHTEQKN